MVSSPSSLATIAAQHASPNILTLVLAISKTLSNTNRTPIASIGKPTAPKITAIATKEAEGTPATPTDVRSAINTIENWTEKVRSSP